VQTVKRANLQLTTVCFDDISDGTGHETGSFTGLQGSQTQVYSEDVTYVG